ncbi:MAG TPA: DUF624 domain-containing protein [Candidatus Eisenbergiella intestinipullorum]|nr:DUF624 domain-containing protein [Candidatus Eisenbergiella intestinipullorum]
MGRFFNLDSPLMVFLSKVADLMILNIIMLFLCIPIITAGDAMTAMYYMTIKMVRGEESYIVRGYFKSFKENFKQATIIWILALLVFFVLVGDFTIINSGVLSFGKIMTVLLVVVSIIYAFTMLYVFPVLSRFENTVKNTIRNAFLMSILNLPRTILLVIINLLPIALFLLVPQAMPFVILFGFSVPAYLCSTQFVKIFRRFEPQEENAAGGEELETLSFIREEEEEKQRKLEEERVRGEIQQEREALEKEEASGADPQVPDMENGEASDANPQEKSGKEAEGDPDGK